MKETAAAGERSGSRQYKKRQLPVREMAAASFGCSNHTARFFLVQRRKSEKSLVVWGIFYTFVPRNQQINLILKIISV